jgi:hypothetical protein
MPKQLCMTKELKFYAHFILPFVFREPAKEYLVT